MRKPVVAVVLAGCGFLLPGAEFSLPGVTVQAGGVALADIRYVAGGSQLAAVQFDLLYDAANLTITATAGPAATAAGKAIGSTDVAPGIKHFFLVGLNQSALGDGAVISLRISSPSGTPGRFPLKLADALAVDTAGRMVGVTTADGAVVVETAGQVGGGGAFGQLASGGVWQTTFTLVNVSSAPVQAGLSFWGGEGDPLSLPILSSGGAPGGRAWSVDCSLAPGAMCVVETGAPEAAATQVGWAELRGPDGVIGFAVLHANLAPDRDSEAMLPLERRTGPSFVLPFDQSAGAGTGIALANQSPDSAADLALVLRDEGGDMISSGTLSLPARGHTSFLVGERFAEVSGRKGTIEVRNNTGGAISVLGLRFNPSGSFTSVPVTAK